MQENGNGDDRMRELPVVQAVPMQSEAIAFCIQGAEVARYNAGWDMFRPYVFPVLGPDGRHVTRMGHPHDPITHRHHYSVWVAHADVNGVDFWSDAPTAGKQVHRNILALEDGATSAAAKVGIDWVGPDGKHLLAEERTYRLIDLPDMERLLDIHLRLSPVEGLVRFGATAFGLAAVRVAKTMCVADGGGQILNAEGALGEEAIFWKRAAWCDYSGPVAPGIWNGIAFFSHPSNADHPPEWHVRSDGWMGACLSREAERVVNAGEAIEMRYGLYVHRGTPNEADVRGAYARFAASEFMPCQK
ncbi:MAG: hypothetical protein FJX75_29930 [Armatimonadetes bacterium]|nr:hypothetical protein [Armatimonadota bacterium]